MLIQLLLLGCSWKRTLLLLPLNRINVASWGFGVSVPKNTDCLIVLYSHNSCPFFFFPTIHCNFELETWDTLQGSLITGTVKRVSNS